MKKISIYLIVFVSVTLLIALLFSLQVNRNNNLSDSDVSLNRTQTRTTTQTCDTNIAPWLLVRGKACKVSSSSHELFVDVSNGIQRSTIENKSFSINTQSEYVIKLMPKAVSKLPNTKGTIFVESSSVLGKAQTINNETKVDFELIFGVYSNDSNQIVRPFFEYLNYVDPSKNTSNFNLTGFEGSLSEVCFKLVPINSNTLVLSYSSNCNQYTEITTINQFDVAGVNTLRNTAANNINGVTTSTVFYNPVSTNLPVSQIKGNIDALNCTEIAGWACVPNLNSVLDIGVFIKTTNLPEEYLVFSGKAGNQRESAVAQICGGYSNRGFKIPIPQYLKTPREITYTIKAKNPVTGLYENLTSSVVSNYKLVCR